MAIDVTLPGTSAEIVKIPPTTPIGVAGTVAIIGRFEKGDGNTPYYILNPNDGLKQMGDDSNYPGAKIIEMAFKKDPLNNNPGATNAICIKAGESIGASCTLIDTTTDTPVDIMTLQVPGGTWGNDLTATVATGTVSGKKLVIKKGTKVIDTFDNCADAESMYNKILSGSVLKIKVTAHDLTKTLKDVADSPFSSGTEVTNPTTADLTNALNVLLEEDFDIIIFTDVPSDSFYTVIEAYLNTRLENDKFTRTTLPIDSTKTIEQVKTILASVNNGLMEFITQTITVGTEELNDAESAARIAGFVAGLPVYESLTNKVISDITALNRTFTKGDSSSEAYVLTDAGCMVLELKSRKDNSYGIVSAVTASHDLGNNGKKTPWSEQHAVRTMCYVCEYLDLKSWLGKTGISKTKTAAEGEINNRISDLMPEDNPIAEDINVVLVSDTENDEITYEDIGVKARGIWKWIHKRINMQE
jgi:hypothetical protein